MKIKNWLHRVNVDSSFGYKCLMGTWRSYEWNERHSSRHFKTFYDFLEPQNLGRNSWTSDKSKTVRNFSWILLDLVDFLYIWVLKSLYLNLTSDLNFKPWKAMVWGVVKVQQGWLRLTRVCLVELDIIERTSKVASSQRHLDTDFWRSRFTVRWWSGDGQTGCVKQQCAHYELRYPDQGKHSYSSAKPRCSSNSSK